MKEKRFLLVLLAMMATAAYAQDDNDDFSKGFAEARKQMYQEYNDFRKQALKEYSDFVRKAWKNYNANPAVPVPEEEKVEPMLAPGADEQTASWFGKLFKKKKKDEKDKPEETAAKPDPTLKGAVIKTDPTAKGGTKSKKADGKSKTKQEPKKSEVFAVQDVIQPAPIFEQPQPVSEVKEVKKSLNPYMSFDVFGTECKVRIGENCRFKLRSLESNAVADAISEFNKPQFDNMLYDCLQERKNHDFSDWAYYQMLIALTNKFYGKDTNEAVLAKAFLYSQSGYKMRLAHDNSRLYMLAASHHFIFNKQYFYLDGEAYYLLENEGTTSMAICEASFPKESQLSLQMTAVQHLSANPLPQRTISSKMDDEFSFTIASNKNYMDFYETYPSSSVDENFMTRWAMYANTPIEKGIRDQLYPAMKKKLEGLSQQMAVQELLWWVQTGFEYQYDENVWGVDRAFFGEETLFYPYCDCEDRSILLSHLIRELLGLDVVLVYYPGHLAMAVGFTEDVEGDCIMFNGKKFIVCDPTYIGSDVGETMPTVKGQKTTVILLEKS